MSEKLSLARIKKFGQTFEISIDQDKAVAFKEGSLTDVREALQSDDIYTDAKKGLRATSENLAKAFQTTDPLKIAEIILKQGEIQVSAEHRAAEREQRRKQLIQLIHKQVVDPKTGLPHPVTRIEAALEEGKIHLDDHKSVEEQFDNIISKLRPIIPISIERKKLAVTIPSTYTGKAYAAVKSIAPIIKEEWKSDGSWFVLIEIPAGLAPEVIDKLNSLTQGEVMIEEKKN